MMRGRLAAMALLLSLVPALPAAAQQAEAKQAALSGNCKPTKLEVLKQVNGRLAETMYKITCGGQKDTFVVVQCRDRTCTIMR